MNTLELIAISVGNSRVHLGHFIGDDMQGERGSRPCEDMAQMVEDGLQNVEERARMQNEEPS